MRDRRLGILHTPVRDAATRPGFHAFRIGIEPELKATDVEPDVERLVEVRLHTERRAVPGLGTLQVGDVIDHRA